LADPRGQAMYSVIHGGIDKILRKKSIDILGNLPFNGHAIGKKKKALPLIF
jgi:queuine tRNA-ribosyltransferase